jgi:hypothetical protein
MNDLKNGALYLFFDSKSWYQLSYSWYQLSYIDRSSAIVANLILL